MFSRLLRGSDCLLTARAAQQMVPSSGSLDAASMTTDNDCRTADAGAGHPAKASPQRQTPGQPSFIQRYAAYLHYDVHLPAAPPAPDMQLKNGGQLYKAYVKECRCYQHVERLEQRPIDQLFGVQPTAAVWICNLNDLQTTKQQLTDLVQRVQAEQQPQHIELLLPYKCAVVVYNNDQQGVAAATKLRAALHKQIVKLPDARTLYVQYVASAETLQCMSPYYGRTRSNSSAVPSAQFLQNISSNACFDYSVLQQHLQSIDCQWSRSQPIPGLMLVNNFITESEEITLLKWLEEQQWNQHKMRHVIHSGFAFNYSTNSIDPQQRIGDLPTELNDVLERLKFIHVTSSETSATPSGQCQAVGCPHATPDVPHFQFTPDQLTINKYQPGHGIPPHTDAHQYFHDCIVSLSLASSVAMDFTYANAESERKRFDRCKLREKQGVRTDVQTVACQGCIQRNASRAHRSVANARCKRIPQLCKGCCSEQPDGQCGNHAGGGGIEASMIREDDGYETDASMVSDSAAQSNKDQSAPVISIMLPRRSLLVLRGEARYRWVHTIAPRKTDVFDGAVHPRQTRISLTFRQVRRHDTQCRCDYRELCDGRFDQQ